ncbi:phosphate ABC transporter, permease protein PstA [Vibrio sp. 10N.286.49.C2]|uniref:phosphate ABC transporter permease PstA n=1 Tax=unclassified Vibrio TaxID=2614977 RepID=UPI000C824C2A|nr:MULTISPECIES: phosphate ABC transporter permease PstA [unclassified Vibrio]PMH33339.1 phosphate ABC transporter, permease protein PstA [Vibrio sp. 10N.286.49.C2]PMH48236.1 phosphate ABC transporter, permease protein PstA [Vibrio sp. 10N.286.49.B1]PMH80404.1 phosphate ABC transporter, permease protein PstA [Vibrio sp. 10N.286.48.B7]
MFKWFKSGAPWVWLTGGAVSISLISVLGLLLLIGWKGLAYFWPAPLYQWQDADGKYLIGQVYSRTWMSTHTIPNASSVLPESVIASGKVERLSIKTANRDLYGMDFVSVLAPELYNQTTPAGLVVIERMRGGEFFGDILALNTPDGAFVTDIHLRLGEALALTQQTQQAIDDIVDRKIRGLGYQLEVMRLKHRKDELNGTLTSALSEKYQQQKRIIQQQLAINELELDQLRNTLNSKTLIVADMKGDRVEVPLSRIVDFWFPNNMTLAEKLTHWSGQVWKFLSDDPRESNSEGGVFPAIFGTVLLVLIMSVMVMPLGVLVALYLHEYAENNWLTRMIRVGVINLAGVPSIVYGVFGLGFFVYTIGGSIDSLFYAERLPAPTFGTPGLLWSALTLAILTLPVVIVTTEEGLNRIPLSARHGSLALGATQFETIWRIVLPMASPAIITGLILAVARAAGEVAPLMLVGVVKFASSLPVDAQFPFLHLERKFMHLGFHIYDVGFQTSNIEAARPLVYATSFLLVTVVVGLNLTAIAIRNNLREKYRTLGQD